VSRGYFDFIAFTSISKDRPLYERDVMNTVCLPEGALVSLTYRRKWIADQTWTACGELARTGRIERMVGGSALKRVLIVLYEGGADPDREFLPLRFASLVAVETHAHLASKFADGLGIEPGVTMIVSLNERPSESLLRSTRDVISACGVAVENPLGRYLVAIDEARRRLGAYSSMLTPPTTWARHVEILVERSKSLKGERSWAIFGAFRSVGGARVGRAAPQLPSWQTRVTTYAMRGGSSYELECHIHESSIQPWSETPIQVGIVGSHLEISPASVSQFGAGAVVNFLVATQRKFSAEIVGMNFNVVGKLNDKLVVVNRGKAPEFHCRIEIAPPKRFWFFTFFLLFLSAFLLNVSADTLKDVHAVFAESAPDPKKVPSSFYSTGALIAKALGGFLVAIASVYALRKMPIGK
jgi:hypothetical protein